jgi:SH3-like domain-containing protein
MLPRLMRLAVSAVLLAVAGQAQSSTAGFVVVGDRAAILYDAPSVRAEKQFVVSRAYPLEVLVRLEQWTKVRDVAGDVGWIENRALGNRRTLIVTADGTEVRNAGNDAAPVVFTAQRGVLLEFNDSAATVPTPAAPGSATTAPAPAAVPSWIRVTHRDGVSGFVRASQVWGH